MRILGIDPGLVRTGYGLIDAEGNRFRLIEAGIVTTSPDQKIQARIKKVYRCLKELTAQYSPDVLVLEKVYSHYRHPTTAILMGHVRGAVCLLCGEKDIPLVNYPATRIKKAVLGRGHASKGQIQRMVMNFLSLEEVPQPADVADALAIALSHVFIKGKHDFKYSGKTQEKELYKCLG